MTIFEKYQRPIVVFLLVSPISILLSFLLAETIGMFVLGGIILLGVLYLCVDTTRIFLKKRQVNNESNSGLVTRSDFGVLSLLKSCLILIIFIAPCFSYLIFLYASKFKFWNFADAVKISLSAYLAVLSIILLLSFYKKAEFEKLGFMSSRIKFFLAIFVLNYISAIIAPHITV